MTKEYLISVNEIADMDRYENEYLPTAGETLLEYGGKPLFVSIGTEVVEGDWGHNHTFVAEFPSAEAAQEWYKDETYQSEELKQLREEVFDYMNIFFAPAFNPREGD